MMLRLLFCVVSSVVFASAVLAGPKCEKCASEVQAAVAACLKSGKDQVTYSKENQSKAQECSNICKAELPKPGQ